MIDTGGQPEHTIADYLSVVRRYRWLIVLAVVLVPVVAYVLSAQQPKVFRATADVLINRQDLGSTLTGIPTQSTATDPWRYARTQAKLAGVPAVVDGAVERAGLGDVEGWSTDVTADPDTDVLTLGVNHGDPDVATRLATAYAESFTAYKLQTDSASLSRARREIQGRLAELRRSGGTGSDTYRELLGQSQDLRTLELLLVPATVIRPAGGAGQIAPTPRRNAILGAVLGLLLGLGGAFGLNALDRRIREAEEVEHELGVPLLARLPGPRRRGDTLMILERPPDEVTEAVSRLRANFDFANGEVEARVVMVTSAGPREGKSTTAANLAVAFARSGRRVILVDLDLRRPALGRMFHLPERGGLTDVATGQADLETALTRVNHSALRVRPLSSRGGENASGVLEILTGGSTRIDPSEFVESPGLADVLQRLRSRAEIVLMDVPPILATADAMALTAKVDAILLVNRLGTLTLPALRDLARALHRSPAPTLGLIATGTAYEESYYYAYHATEEEAPAPDVAALRRKRQQERRRQEPRTPAVQQESGATESARWARPNR